MKKIILTILAALTMTSFSACEFKLIPDQGDSKKENVEEKKSAKTVQVEEIQQTTPTSKAEEINKTTGKIFTPSPEGIRPNDAIPPKETQISGEAQFSSQSFKVRNSR